MHAERRGAAAPAATARHVDLVGHWHLNAPPARVYGALNDCESWPRWWPSVRRVRTLRAGGVDGLGSVRRIVWTTRLTRDIATDVEVVDVLRPERLRGRSSGPLRGEGLWLLRAEGGGTAVTHVWRVELDQPWMRWLAPLLAPLVRWSHDGVMRAGAAGLARHLCSESG